MNADISARSSIFFVSDLHLGAPNHEQSLIRERHFVQWLDHIKPTAKELFLVGDIFDFWFEYGHAVPKGYIRLLGKLAELADTGVQIHIFTGNHDLWYKDYFPQQLGAKVFSKPLITTFYDKHFYIAHGDGLGPGDHGYKFLKGILTNPMCKWLFARLHPNFGIGLANYFSGLSRDMNNRQNPQRSYYGKKEYLYVHANNVLKQNPELNYFVFGHRHIATCESLNPSSKLFLLGDWINHFTYLEVSPDEVALKSYPIT